MKRLYTLFLVIAMLFSLSATAWATGGSSGSEKVTYTNDMTSADGLELVKLNSTSSFEVATGGVKFTRQPGTGNAFLIDTNAPSARHGKVTLKVTSPAAFEVGVLFRYVDSSNYCYAVVNWEGKLVHIVQVVNGGASFIKDNIQVSYDTSNGFTLEIEYISKQYALNFNGSTIWAGACDSSVETAGKIGIMHAGNSSATGYTGEVLIESLSWSGSSSYIQEETEGEGGSTPPPSGGSEDDGQGGSSTVTGGTVTYTNPMSSLTGLNHVKYTSTSSLEKVSGGVKFSRDQGTGRTLFVDTNSPYARHGKATVKITGAAYEAGVVFRYVDENNFSYAFVNWNGGLIHVYQVINGEAIPLATSLQCDRFYSTDSLTLTVDYIGKQIAVSINGSTIWADTCENVVEVAGKIGVVNNGDSSMAGYTGAFVVESLTYSGSESYVEEEPEEDNNSNQNVPTDPNAPISYNNGMSSLSGLKHVKYSSTSALEKVSGGVKFSRDQGTGRTLFVDKNSPNARHGKATVKITGTAYEAGVVFRYVDENNFSYAFVNWNGGLIHVYQIVNGEAVILASSLQCDRFYSTDGLTLTVEYIGKQIAVSINGSTIWADTCENVVEVAGKIGVVNNGDSSMAGYTGAFVVESLSYSGVYSYLAPETGDNIVVSLVAITAVLGGAALVIGKRKKHE